MAAGLDELYGLGFDSSDNDEEKIMKITTADVQAVADKYLTPEHYILAVTHP